MLDVLILVTLFSQSNTLKVAEMTETITRDSKQYLPLLSSQ